MTRPRVSFYATLALYGFVFVAFLRQLGGAA